MYIDPFWAGVLATICAEISLLFIAAVVATFRRGKK